MDNFQKIGLIVIAILAAIYLKMAFFTTKEIPAVPENSHQLETEAEQVTPSDEQAEDEDSKVAKEYVNVFFIAHNDKGEEVYRAVKREYSPEFGSKLKFAVKTLINGPSDKEKKLGVYSEIPAGTKLISVVESPSRVVVDLSSEFENGGGTDGLYKRLFQLIKTVKNNSNLPLYLQLNGKQVEVIGGEGIMINQPLNEDFVNE